MTLAPGVGAAGVPQTDSIPRCENLHPSRVICERVQKRFRLNKKDARPKWRIKSATPRGSLKTPALDGALRPLIAGGSWVGPWISV